MQKVRALFSSPVAMVVVAFLVRAAYLFIVFGIQPVSVGNHSPIGGEVASIAASIAAGNGFSSPLSTPSGPTAWSTPVFPLLLAACFKAFGIFTFKANTAIRLLDIFFSSLTCYPLVLLGRRLFSDATGIVSGWFWALFPKAIYFSVVWVWDTSLAALFLCTCVLATYAVRERASPKIWLGYGALWGFAILVNAALLAVFPGSLFFAGARGQQRTARPWPFAGIAVLGFALAVSPWVIRNQLVFHGQVLFRSNFGLELWLGNNPEVPVSSSWWLHPTESAEEKDKFLRMGEVAYMQEKKKVAVQFITTHPADTLRFQYHRFMETWTGFGDPFLDIWPGAKPGLRAELLSNYVLALLMLLGLLCARRNSGVESLPLLNVIALFPAVYYVTHTTPRYRHPMDPIIVLLAAYAVVSGARYVSGKVALVGSVHQVKAVPWS